MPSTADFSDILPHRISAREDHALAASPPSSRSHKRVDSTEVKSVGAHLYPPAKQTSWPRPTHIDIPVEESTSTQSDSEHRVESHEGPSGYGHGLPDSSRGAHAIPSPPAPTRDTHHMSMEDATLLKDQRDILRDKMNKRGSYLPLVLPLHSSTSSGIPGMKPSVPRIQSSVPSLYHTTYTKVEATQSCSLLTKTHG